VDEAASLLHAGTYTYPSNRFKWEAQPRKSINLELEISGHGW